MRHQMLLAILLTGLLSLGGCAASMHQTDGGVYYGAVGGVYAAPGPYGPGWYSGWGPWWGAGYYGGYYPGYWGGWRRAYGYHPGYWGGGRWARPGPSIGGGFGGSRALPPHFRKR